MTTVRCFKLKRIIFESAIWVLNLRTHREDLKMVYHDHIKKNEIGFFSFQFLFKVIYTPRGFLILFLIYTLFSKIYFVLN